MTTLLSKEIAEKLLNQNERTSLLVLDQFDQATEEAAEVLSTYGGELRLNGLLLPVQFDALFDSGLMTFDDSGAVKISPRLSAVDRKLLSLGSGYRLRSKPDPKHLPFLAWHREKVFKS